MRKGTRDGFARRFGLPGTNYSFRHNDAHFAVVDNAGGALTDDTLSWLDRDLAAHPAGKDGVSVIVVAMHAPPRTAGISPHGVNREYVEQSAKLLGILKRHRVDLILCSHEHMHHDEDWEGIRVIVSGGAGAPLMLFQRSAFYQIDVDGERIRGTFLPVKPGKRPDATPAIPSYIHAIPLIQDERMLFPPAKRSQGNRPGPVILR